MRDPEFHSFEEFWPYYVREHANKTNRTLHFIGTSAALGIAAASLVTRRPALLLLAPVMGYGFAWVGHCFVEHNRPATFKHPLWSLRGDFKMWAKMLDGSMDAEVERVLSQDSTAQGNGAGNGVSNFAADPHTVN